MHPFPIDTKRRIGHHKHSTGPDYKTSPELFGNFGVRFFPPYGYQKKVTQVATEVFAGRC